MALRLGVVARFLASCRLTGAAIVSVVTIIVAVTVVVSATVTAVTVDFLLLRRVPRVSMATVVPVMPVPFLIAAVVAVAVAVAVASMTVPCVRTV